MLVEDMPYRNMTMNACSKTTVARTARSLVDRRMPVISPCSSIAKALTGKIVMLPLSPRACGVSSKLYVAAMSRIL
jgi:hypothetical protein